MNKQKIILILGCGTMQVPALKIAGDMGWYVAAADGNSEAEGRPLTDKFFHVDLKDVDGLIRVARNLQGSGGLDGVFTAGTDFSLSVALVAEALGLPGHTPEAAMLATDKVAMRCCFRDNGVASPAFIEVGDDDDPSTAAESVPGPWVVKPVDSMGARGVIRIDHVKDLSAALTEARGYSRSGRALLESYMEGPEYSLDALIENGRLIRCGLADRHIYYPPHFIEVGHTIPSQSPDHIIDEIWRVFEEGVHALGLSCGAAKGDVMLTPEGPMIGEIAARLSGGYMSGWTWPAASGVEPTRGGLCLAVGIDSGITGQKKQLICAERALISIDGTVRRLDGQEAARKLPGVEEIFLRYQPGEKVSFPRNNVEKAGNVIVVGKDFDESSKRAQAALQALNLELDPKDSRTGAYLDDNKAFPPDALELKSDYLETLWQLYPPKPSRGCPVDCPQIKKVLPGQMEVQDLAGRSVGNILEILLDERWIELTESDDFTDSGPDMNISDTVNQQIQSNFWKAMKRGGLAGARWYLERSGE